MNEVFAAMAAPPALTTAPPIGDRAQPAAHLAAQFEELIAQPAAVTDGARYVDAGDRAVSYSEPASALGLSAQLHPLIDYMGQASDQLRAQLETPGLSIDPEMWPELHLMQQTQLGLRDFMRAELQIEMIGKALQLAGRNVQVLYQQQG